MAHPGRLELRLEIKGPAARLQPPALIEFRAPRFDFDGLMVEDVAAGHDDTLSGGGWFQQAAVEYAIRGRVNALGYATVRCIGHDIVTREDCAS